MEILGGGRPTACADDAPRAPGRTRAFLKVQNGCDSRCAFCIIPTTRGGAESRPMARILADARRRLGGADGDHQRGDRANLKRETASGVHPTYVANETRLHLREL